SSASASGPATLASGRIRVGLDQVGEKVPAHVYGPYAAALVEAVHAIAIRVCPGARYAIDGNADGLEEDTVGRAGRHGRNERYTGKVLRHELLGRPDDLRLERWRYGDGSHRRHGA